MELPFDSSDFFHVFADYNEAVFPAQIGLYVIAAVIVWITVRWGRYSGKLILWGLGLLWLWCGIAYHLMFFTDVNRGAYLFGGLFVLEGLLLLIAGWRWPSTAPATSSLQTWTAWAMIAYALVFYPILGWLFGHHYPATPTFGLPCPLTIFTFGIMLASREQPFRGLLIIPTLWALIGTVAVFSFGVYQDVLLLISAGIFWWIVWRKRGS